MEQARNIASELKEISNIVAGIEKVTPFSVPNGYFAGFPEKILAIIRYNNSIILSSNQEIESVSPLLASLKSKQTFIVPENYFEQLEISDLLHDNQQNEKIVSPAPVFSISTGRKWMRYAVAAAIAGLIGLGILFFLNNAGDISGNGIINSNDIAIGQQKNQQSLEELSELPDDILDGYLSGMPVEANETVNAETGYFDFAILNVDDKGMMDLLHEISDEDLRSFADEDAKDYL